MKIWLILVITSTKARGGKKSDTATEEGTNTTHGNNQLSDKQKSTGSISVNNSSKEESRGGSKESFEYAYASIPFEQNSHLPKMLGCNLTDQGHIEVNAMQKTTQEGIFACGDNSSMMRSVATAVYGRNLTGAMINHELTQESF